MNLETWMNDERNVYVGRAGRIFIGSGANKRIFHYAGSKFANPYKVKPHGEYTTQKSLDLYKKYLVSSGLINDIEELRGKNLGCFCDQSGECHAKILAKYLE